MPSKVGSRAGVAPHDSTAAGNLRMAVNLQEIRDLAMLGDPSSIELPIPRVMRASGNVPPHRLAALYHPMIGFVVDGMKQLSIGGCVIRLIGPSYYLLPIHVPVTGTVRPGRDGRPYLSVGLSLSLGSLRDLLKDVSEGIAQGSGQPVAACAGDPDFVEAWLRMLRLLRTPGDIRALAPVYEREILYRVLLGPQGPALRQLAFRDSGLSKVSQTVHWLRAHYAQPMNIQELCKLACMGATTFHRHFKRVTGLSPLQFQKQLRLLEARRLMVFDGEQAAPAAHAVGYRSVTQFTREYSRHFGASPARDATRVRQLEGLSGG